MKLKFLSRKLLFILLLLAMGFSIDFFTERGLSENLLELMKWLGGTYVLGNVGTELSRSISSKKEK